MSTPLKMDRHIPHDTALGCLEVCEMLHYDFQTDRPLIMILHNLQKEHFLCALFESRAEGDVWLYRKLAGSHTSIGIVNGALAIGRSLEYSGDNYCVTIGRDSVCTLVPAQDIQMIDLIPRGYDDEHLRPEEN